MINCGDYIPAITVHTDSLSMYPVYTGPRKSHSVGNESLKNLTDNNHYGSLSSVTIKKMKRAINYLLFLSAIKPVYSIRHKKSFNYKIAFITLTLPSSQVHTDNEIKRQCLNQFLTELEKKFKVTNYIWRAEKQANRNIHFHILVNKFVPWSELRDTWNRIVNKIGYVDRYRNNMLEFHKTGFRLRTELLHNWSKGAQVNAYRRGIACDWNSPNSTDIHAVKQVKKLRAYVTKYMSKSEQSEFRSYRLQYLQSCVNSNIPLDDEMLDELEQLTVVCQTGRMWGCSYNLSQITGARDLLSREYENEISILKSQPRCYKFETQYSTTIYYDPDQLYSLGLKNLIRLLAQYIQERFHYYLIT